MLDGAHVAGAEAGERGFPRCLSFRFLSCACGTPALVALRRGLTARNLELREGRGAELSKCDDGSPICSSFGVEGWQLVMRVSIDARKSFEDSEARLHLSHTGWL